MVLVVVSIGSEGLLGTEALQSCVPQHLEDIVAGSHPSLGAEGWATLRNVLHQYAHVFPAPGEPVTGRTTTVQHDIETNDTRPVL